MVRFFWLALVAPAMLAGCNPAKDEAKVAATEACEIFVKERIRSPSTYVQVSVDDDGVIFKDSGRDVKMVIIEYDAANAFGTPVRGSQQCVFEVDEKGNYAEDPAHAAKMSAIGSGEHTPCCLLDKDDTNSPQSVDEVAKDM